MSPAAVDMLVTIYVNVVNNCTYLCRHKGLQFV